MKKSSKIELWEIIHEIPGRVRLRLAWLQEYPSLHLPLETALINLRGVNEVRLSSINNAIIIHYDEQIISPEDFQAELSKIFLLMTPPTWIDAYLEEKKQANQIEEKNPEIRLDFEFLAETWQENKQSILMGAGTTCLVIGGLLVPLPLVPGWPLLLLGSYCLKLASEKPS